MFSDKHFVNCKVLSFNGLGLISQLAKKQAANKLEKFIAERIEEKIESLTVDSQINGKSYDVSL